MITNLKEGQTITIRTESEAVKIHGESCPGLTAYAAGALVSAATRERGSILCTLSFIEGYAMSSGDDWKKNLKDFSKAMLKVLEKRK